MQIDITFEFIKVLEERYPLLPKNVAYPISKGFGINFATGRFWVLLSLSVGKRGGLREQLVAYDTTASIVADKLFLCVQFRPLPLMLGTREGLLDLSVLRKCARELPQSQHQKVFEEALFSASCTTTSDDIKKVAQELLANHTPRVTWHRDIPQELVMSGGTFTPK